MGAEDVRIVERVPLPPGYCLVLVAVTGDGSLVGELWAAAGHRDHGDYRDGPPSAPHSVRLCEVDPRWRRRGVASALLDAARDRLGDSLAWELSPVEPAGEAFLAGYARRRRWAPEAVWLA